MSARLFAVAALCLVASVSAQSIISRNFYAQSGCGGAILSQQNFTVGLCTPSSGGYQSSAWYTSASGDAVYQYTFSDRNCTAASAYSISSVPTTCGGPGSNFMKYVVINPSAAPIAFPPSGWATSSSYFNLSNSRQASTCAAGADILVTQSAFQLGGCRRVDSTFGTQPTYTATFCLAGDANQAGSAVFSDSGCSTIYNAAVSPINVCKNGVQTASCPSGAATFPSLPTTGSLQYSNDDCSGALQSTTYTTSACFNSATFVCGTINGTTMATVSSFVDTTNKGLCSNTAAMTKSYLADATTCYNGKKYNCAFNPTPIAAASASASSVVAMIVAAVLAVFATRSL